MFSGELAVILNGVSRKKKRFYRQILPGLQSDFKVRVWETQHHNHAKELAEQALQLNPFGIFAAGGDGTLNQVLNGVLQSKTSGEKPAIGIIPLGTGNDFSRLNSIEPTAESVINKVKGGAKLTDVGLLRCRDYRGNRVNHYFINVASLGMGPEVVRRLFRNDRILGSAITYLKASIETFFSHQPESVEIKTECWSWNGKIRVLAVANGKSFGGGLFVAPDSAPDDGTLNTFIAGEVPLLRFLLYLQKIKSAAKILDKQVHYNWCKTLSLTSTEQCWIETEGELAGLLPAKIEIIPGGVRFYR